MVDTQRNEPVGGTRPAGYGYTNRVAMTPFFECCQSCLVAKQSPTLKQPRGNFFGVRGLPGLVGVLIAEKHRRRKWVGKARQRYRPSLDRQPVLTEARRRVVDHAIEVQVGKVQTFDRSRNRYARGPGNQAGSSGQGQSPGTWHALGKSDGYALRCSFPTRPSARE